MKDTKKIHLDAEPAKNGMMTAAVTIDNAAPFYLHSVYDPEQEAQDWLKTIELTANTMYIVLGFGLGYHIKALLAALPENSRVIVIEPFKDKSMHMPIRQIMADCTWMEDSRLQVAQDTRIREISVGIAEEMTILHLHWVSICPHFPSIQMYPEYYADLNEHLLGELEAKFLIQIQVGIYNSGFLAENAWRNLPYIFNNPGLDGFKGAYANKPVIIVSAGPSLNKNIAILKECADKAIIIACGSANEALHKHGITPHILASLDPFPETYGALQQTLSADSILLAGYDTIYELVADYPGPMFFPGPGNSRILAEIQPFLPATINLRRSVSVSTCALDFAVYVGADPIIFVGQDCAIYDTVTHADGVTVPYDREDDTRLDPVEGQDGSILKTTLGLKEVLQYFQDIIVTDSYKGKTFINASEGGALIKGMAHMPLRQVKDQYLTQDFMAAEPLREYIRRFVPANPAAFLLKLAEIKDKIEAFRQSVVKEFGDINEDITIEPGVSLNDALNHFFTVIQAAEAYSLIKPLLDKFIAFTAYRARDGFKDNEQMEMFVLIRKRVLLASSDMVSWIEECSTRLKQ